MTRITDFRVSSARLAPMNTTAHSLPVQVAPGFPLRVRGNSDASGGWTIATFDTRADMLAFMDANPRAELPCWRRVRNGEV